MSNSSLRLFQPDGGDDSPDSVNSTTVQQVIDWFWIRHTPSKSPAANKERRRVIDLFSKQFGPIPVSNIIGSDLVDFVANTGKKDKSANTIDRWYRTIKQPFHLAEQLGFLDRPSPFRAVKSPRGSEGRDLSDNEFRSLLRESTPALPIVTGKP